MVINTALGLVGAGIGVLNMWFLYELYRLAKIEKKNPLTDISIPTTAQDYRNLHPVNGSIYRLYASLRSVAPPNHFELSVINDAWDAPKIKTYIGSRDITHVIIMSKIYSIESFVGSVTKDACIDFVTSRCDILERDAPINVDVYKLREVFDFKAPTPHNDISPALIEYHVWVTSLT